MVTRRLLWKWRRWKSIGFYPYMYIHITSIVLLKFGVDIQSQTKFRVPKQKKSNIDARRRFWKWRTSLKINRLLPRASTHNKNIVLLKFGVDIQSQTKLSIWKPQKSSVAIRRPFWKWRRWKSIGFYPYTQVLYCGSSELIFKAKLKLKSGNKKSNMATRRPFWKWRRWKSIGY